MSKSIVDAKELEERLASKEDECTRLTELLASQVFEIQQLRLGIEVLSTKNEELFREKRQREENMFNLQKT